MRHKPSDSQSNKPVLPSVVGNATDPSAWQNSVCGRYIGHVEQDLHDKAVVNIFGFNALQMGAEHLDLLMQSRIANRYKLVSTKLTSVGKWLPPQSSQQTVFCDDDFLPFSEMSVDVLLLPHRLEFSTRPHQTLREAERVLMPEGHLLITGFNPMSLWGIKAMRMRLTKKKSAVDYPWSGRFIGLTRLKEWLSLLGFEVVSQQVAAFVPPLESVAWHRRLSFFDRFACKYLNAFGGVYFIVAKKRVVGMTPIKPDWKKNAVKSRLVASQPSGHQQAPSQNNTKKSKEN